MEFNLKKILKALLFSSSQWLSIKDIQAVVVRYNKEMETSKLQNNELSEDFSQENSTINYENQATMLDLIKQVPTLLTATQIREAIEELQAQLIEDNDVYTLIQGAEGWKIAINDRYSRWVRLLRNEPKPQKLSQAALETLAVVAYRQPVTRAEIESIRGVNADGGINRLLDKELIFIAGRADLPGRPLQYATSSKFLEYIGISSLEELPSSDVLSPNQISQWIKKANNPELFTDKEMGLSPSEIEIDENIVENSENSENIESNT